MFLNNIKLIHVQSMLPMAWWWHVLIILILATVDVTVIHQVNWRINTIFIVMVTFILSLQCWASLVDFCKQIPDHQYHNSIIHLSKRYNFSLHVILFSYVGSMLITHVIKELCVLLGSRHSWWTTERMACVTHVLVACQLTLCQWYMLAHGKFCGL